MKKHIVTCVKCGKQFDANEGGAYYPESRRYVCKHCVDKRKAEQAERNKARKAAEREAEADERERVTGMRQSKTATLRRELVYGRFVNIPYEPVKTRFALDFLPLHTVPESAIIIKV